MERQTEFGLMIIVLEQYGVDAKVLRFKKKWQDLYIPDLNNAFVVPYPNASYKLLDRVLVVRSGYPVKHCVFSMNSIR